MRKIILLFVLFFGVSGLVLAQVSIAPPSLYMDEQNRFGSFLVLNSSDQMQEVNLEFLFGYPATDDSGNTYMRYDDEEAEKLYSASEWIRGFPRAFVLEPGARQTVRLMVHPPVDIPDGMYWTRIKTTSNPVNPDLDAADAEGEVSARISFRVEQISAGFFTKGEVYSGLEIKEKAVHVEEDKATFLTQVHRVGNAPFIGRKKMRVLNESGNEVYSSENNTTVYLDAVRKIEYDISGWSAGRYRAEITFVTERSNISGRDLAQSDTVTEAVYFTIN